MLEEHKYEERSGYNFSGAGNSYSGMNNNNDVSKNKGNASKREDDIIDTYGDDFEEEIDEDIPEDNHLLESGGDVNPHKNITESGGITVSQSLGVDPSVDSLALEDYDHIEPVERLF